MNTLTPQQPGTRSSWRSRSALAALPPMKKAWSTWARPAARRSFSSRSASVRVSGLVFGISKIAVTPPSAAAAVPVARSSLCSAPGSRKCTWVSITPGRTVSPSAAMRSAADAPASAPIAAMRPPRTPTSVSSSPIGVNTGRR